MVRYIIYSSLAVTLTQPKQMDVFYTKPSFLVTKFDRVISLDKSNLALW